MRNKIKALSGKSTFHFNPEVEKAKYQEHLGSNGQTDPLSWPRGLPTPPDPSQGSQSRVQNLLHPPFEQNPESLQPNIASSSPEPEVPQTSAQQAAGRGQASKTSSTDEKEAKVRPVQNADLKSLVTE